MVLAYSDPPSVSINGYYSVSNSVVLHLAHGDRVDLGDCTDASSIRQYGSSFSGFLLKAD